MGLTPGRPNYHACTELDHPLPPCCGCLGRPEAGGHTRQRDRFHRNRPHHPATLKIGRRHASHAELSLPYLKNSVLLAKLIPLEPDFPPGTSSYDPSEDGLKVSITGTLHGSIVSFSTKYVFTRIITADSDNFMDRPEFQNPNLRDLEFWQLFVQPVPGAISVHDAIMRGSP